MNWIHFLGIQTSSGLLFEQGSEPMDSVKGGEFLDPLKDS
jgi:hypothetical protein